MFEKENRTPLADMEQYVQHLNYDLAGRTYQLVYDDGLTYMLHFLDGHTVLIGVYGESPSAQRYDCMKSDEITYFVHIELLNQKPRRAVTFILDLEQSLTTRVDATSGREPDYPRWTVDVATFGAIQAPGRTLSQKRHAYTKDLVGSKICWYYWKRGGLTHLYQDGKMRLHFTPEIRASFDEDRRKRGEMLPVKEDGERLILFEEPTFYIKIKQDMYLAAWSEGNMTHQDPMTGGGDGLILINTRRVMDCGRFFGLTKELVPLNQMIGAFGRFVYDHYPEEDIPSLDRRTFTVAGEESTAKA